VRIGVALGRLLVVGGVLAAGCSSSSSVVDGGTDRPRLESGVEHAPDTGGDAQGADETSAEAPPADAQVDASVADTQVPDVSVVSPADVPVDSAVVDAPPSDTAAAETGPDAGPVCGNGVVERGEGCDFPDGVFCQNCQRTGCWNFLAVHNGLLPETDTVCKGMTGTAHDKCWALLNCLADGGGNPCAVLGTCYTCADAACTGGASGDCVDQFNDVAGTTDPVEVLRQTKDVTTTAGKLFAEANNHWPNSGMGGFSCPVLGLKLNEIDVDQPGTDDAEFVEYHNNSGRTVVLDQGLELDLVDGPVNSQQAQKYLTLSTANKLRVPPGAFVVFGAPSLAVPPGVIKIDLPSPVDNIRNGPGGVCGGAFWGFGTGASWTTSPLFCGSTTFATEPANFVDSDVVPASLCFFENTSCPTSPLMACADSSAQWTVCKTPTPGAQNIR
jgi:hypothetical protein